MRDMADTPTDPGSPGASRVMMAPVHHDVVQGSDDWHRIRRGQISASILDQLITPGGKPSRSGKTRMVIYELAAERLAAAQGLAPEPGYVSDDMAAGHYDEARTRAMFTESTRRRVDTCGIYSLTWWRGERSYTLHASPDGLLPKGGVLEVKRRRPKYLLQQYLEWHGTGSIPWDFWLQVQAQLMVTQREYCELITVYPGIPSLSYRVEPDRETQRLIVETVESAEEEIVSALRIFSEMLERPPVNLRVLPALEVETDVDLLSMFDGSRDGET